MCIITENKRKAFLNAFEDLSEWKKFEVYQEFVSNNKPNYSLDMDEWFNVDESFNQHFDGLTPIQIATKIQGSGFDYSKDYFRYNRSGILVSGDFSNVEDDIEELIEYIAEDEDSWSCIITDFDEYYDEKNDAVIED